MQQPIWSPSPANMAKSQMQHFINKINNEQKLNFTNYQQLYQWSIEYPELFWSSLWGFFQIKSSQRWNNVLINGDKMPGAKWFTGAKLNFAENLLSRRDDHLALITTNEKNERNSLTYRELYTKVANLAAHFRALGLKPNDRVAAVLPNFAEAIIAMLATTSIGAIWSSCSPDFGQQALVDRFGQIAPKFLISVDGYHYNGKAYEITDKIAELQINLDNLEQTIIVPYIKLNTYFKSLPNTISYDEIPHYPVEDITFEPLPFDHPVYILYSSGTTGAPKCIVHGAGGTLLQHLKELALHTDLTANDRITYYTTCSWMMWNWFVSSLALGATLVLYDGAPFYPKTTQLFDLIDEEAISIFGTSAKFLSTAEKMGLHPQQTHRLTALRTILSTGSPLLATSYDYVYDKIKAELCLASISGGTDIISCFALGNPLLPVYRGELQCIGLGLSVAIYDEQGQPVLEKKGELVCTRPFPCMPVYFWNDPTGQKYQQAYFAKYPNIWAHGDYAEITEHYGMIIYGRSDAILNPGGVRIGTAEIYQQVEHFSEIIECIAVAQEWQDDVRIILFVKLKPDFVLTEELKNAIKVRIRNNTSPRHVPAKIIAVADIPKTANGKIVELAVREIIHDRPVKNITVIANPEALEYYKNLTELKT